MRPAGVRVMPKSSQTWRKCCFHQLWCAECGLEVFQCSERGRIRTCLKYEWRPRQGSNLRPPAPEIAEANAAYRAICGTSKIMRLSRHSWCVQFGTSVRVAITCRKRYRAHHSDSTVDVKTARYHQTLYVELQANFSWVLGRVLGMTTDEVSASAAAQINSLRGTTHLMPLAIVMGDSSCLGQHGSAHSGR